MNSAPRLGVGPALDLHDAAEAAGEVARAVGRMIDALQRQALGAHRLDGRLDQRNPDRVRPAGHPFRQLPIVRREHHLLAHV